jgi:hypothetical protein
VVRRAGFLLDLFFDREDGGDVPAKRRSTFNGLHGVISQKIKIYNHRHENFKAYKFFDLWKYASIKFVFIQIQNPDISAVILNFHIQFPLKSAP